MKALLPLVFSLFILAFTTFPGDVKEVVSAFKEANVEKITKHFDESLQCNINGRTGTYSKDQAAMLLRAFFQNQALKRFELVHTGKSGNAEFFVGTLSGKNGNFRTTVYIKTYANHCAVQDISIEQQ